MYQVTAIYQNNEIGYGEGEGDHYAIEDCMDSIPQIFKDAYTKDIRLIVRYGTGDIVYTTSILQYALDTH